MRNLLATIALAVAGFGLVGASAAEAMAQNRYALTQITNPTDVTITYHYRWGETGLWKRSTLRPNQWNKHWHTYSYENQNRSPRLYVRLDVDTSAGVWVKQYFLVSYAVPTIALPGKIYRVGFVPGQRNIIALFHDN